MAAAPFVNGFDTSQIGNYNAIFGKALGETASARNPRTGAMEELVQSDLMPGDDFSGTPASQQYGFLSDNPTYKGTTAIRDLNPMKAPSGFGKIASNPMTYLMILAGGLAGGAAGGAGSEMVGSGAGSFGGDMLASGLGTPAQIAAYDQMFAASMGAGVGAGASGGDWLGDFNDMAPGSGGDWPGNFEDMAPGSTPEVPVEDRSKIFNPSTSGGLPQVQNAIASLLKSAGVSNSFAGSMGNLPFNAMSGAGSIFSGLMGLDESRKLRRDSMKAAASQDPFGGMRPEFQRQLMELMQNPNSVTSRPNYKFGYDQGLQAVMRQLAAGGQLGGGGGITAATKYGQDYAQNFYNTELSRLMTLSGAGIAPSGGNIAFSGTNAATGVTSNSIDRLLYGLTRLAA